MSQSFDEARVQRLRASIQDTPTPDLVDAAAMAAYEAETARCCYALLCDALGQRRGEASILTGTDSEAEVTISNSYEWNGEGLAEALQDEGYAPGSDSLVIAVRPSTIWKVNTARLLPWAKKRGLSDLVAKYYTKTESARWSFRDRAKPEEQSK